MRKHYFLFLFALVSTYGFTQNRSVTFQVDLGSTSPSANGVHIAGDFQSAAGATGNWKPDETTLTQVGTSTIYSVTVSIPDGRYEYKMLNGDNWPDEETIPSESQVGGGNGNRFINIYKDTTLAAVEFSGNAPAGKELLRIGADMAQAGTYGTVTAAGNWQAAAGFASDWNATATELFADPNRANVYERLVYVPADTFQLKLIEGGNWETVPSACEVGGNRQVIVSGAVIEENCYAMCGPCPAAPLPQYNMTLMLDMQNHLACNMMDSLDVAGSLNGWAGGDLLTDMGNNIWAVTLMVDSGEVQFKFRSHLGGNVSWEGVPNRVAVHSSADTVMACFNVDGLGGYCNPIPAKADITFRVDMATWGGSIDTAGVYVIGDFTAWQTNAIQMTPLPGGIYETTVSDFCPGSMYFKFVNGTPDPSNSSNEENAGLDSTCAVDNGVGGMNRFYERTSSNAITFDLIFDSCAGMNISIDEEEKTDIVKMYPNPMNNSAWIELTEGKFDVTVVDLSGRALKTLSNVSGKVEITRDNLTSGLYIVTVTNDKGAASSAKLIVE